MKIIRLAVRSLLHFKLYSAVNIVGFALCLMCVVVIARYVYNESTVDRFNSNLERIYVTTYERSNWSGKISFSGVWNPNGEKNFVDVRKDPAVEKSSNYIAQPDNVFQVEDDTYTVKIVAADTSFLQILDYGISAGSGDLSAPDNVLITESFARKVFGEDDPLGKQMHYNGTGKTVTITGIIAPSRTKSSFDFEVLIPFTHSDWGRVENTLILLYPGQDDKAFNEKYSDFFEMSRWDYSVRYQLFPLKDVYMNQSIADYGGFLHGKASTVLVLTLVGLLILLVGVFNFINIYTAVVLRRGREFGMKKVFGASGGRVFSQLLVENLLLILLAVILALALTEILNPLVRNLLGFDQLPFRRFDLFLTLGLLVILPLITTIFPFFHYNYSTPVKSLRSVGKTGGKSAARKILLTFQYVLTIGMIIVSLFFLKQLHFMTHADPGYRTTDIIQVPFLVREGYDYETSAEKYREFRQKKDEIVQKMDASTLFSGWTFGSSPIGSGYTTNFRFGDDELKPVTITDGDERWLNIFDLELVEGRFFDNEIENFYTYHLMVTESALPYFGITDIRTEKLQSESRFWWSSDRQEEMKTNPPYEIVGVVKNFYPSHLGIGTPPIVIMFDDGDGEIIAAVAPGKRQEAIEFLQQLHAETMGGEFVYSFIEDDVAALYREDRKVATVYSIFTAIAILVSVMGLFSMSLFDVQQRRREIAIRKVNGATTGDVLGLLLKRYLYLLLVAFIIAAPIGYFAIQKYLEGFARKAPVSIWIFAAGLLITAAVSLLTLIWQTAKAAGANPAEVVRSE